jgi:hypothetical protein
MVQETGCKSDNYLDLKNPYFRYNGTTPQPPPGSNNVAPSNDYCSGMTLNVSNGSQKTSSQPPDSYDHPTGGGDDFQKWNTSAHTINTHHLVNSNSQSQQSQQQSPVSVQGLNIVK